VESEDRRRRDYTNPLMCPIGAHESIEGVWEPALPIAIRAQDGDGCPTSSISIRPTPAPEPTSSWPPAATAAPRPRYTAPPRIDVPRFGGTACTPLMPAAARLRGVG